MGLLFLNAFKGLKSKKVQMFGIIFLVMLSTGIYTAMNSAIDRLEDRYYNYLEEQNVEDFTFVPVIDYSKDYTKEEIEELKKNELKDISNDQMKLVNNYQMTIGMNNLPNLDSLYKAIDWIFNNSGATSKKVAEKVETIMDKYDFSYYIESAKVAKEEKNIFKAIEYSSNKDINKPYLLEGRFPIEDNEITVLPDFAKLNNLSIGNKYKIGEKEYKIVGYAFSSEHIYPLLSFNSPIFNSKTNCIVFMNKNTYENFGGVKEVSYVGAFNDTSKLLEFEELQNMFKEEKNIELSIMSVARLARVNALAAEIQTDRTFAEYFLYLLLAISVFIILVVTKKRIEDERLQIGVLKALGYKSFGIAISYLVYPIVGSLIGSIIGYTLGLGLHGFLANIYVSFFNLPIDGYVFNLKYLFMSIMIPLILLSALSFLIAIFMLRHKPLYLLKEGSNLKVNLFSKFTNFITRKLPFKSRFRYSLASRSTGKLIIVTLTSFCTGLLIVLILIGMNLFSSMIKSTFDGLNFNNMVSYSSVKEGVSNSEDLIYDSNMVLKEVKRLDGSIEKIKNKNDKDVTITVSGIDKNPKYIEIKDKNGNNLLNNLSKSNDIIINTNISERYKIYNGDTVMLEVNNKIYEYSVVGVQNSFMGTIAYTNRNEISKLFELEDAYNKKYTCDKKYDNLSLLEKDELDNITGIFSIADLKNNMNDSIKASNASLYVVIIFACIMALIIIGIIANIVVEENKRTISLMKVMGYKNKEISSIVLNIYTPFVIIAYILSIPVMKKILETIVAALTKDMSFALPIEFSLIKAFIGLIGLLISYYTAITLSRKQLNKVPLSVALKRE